MFPNTQTTREQLPRRTDSLVASKGPYFVEIEDELRDIKRVNAQGQEEDLRLALSRMIARVEELTSMLKEAFKAQTDLQTEITLSKSNLQLALANNEMLEDALKREGGGHGKDIGWRRWSAKEQKEREAEEERRRSVDSAGPHDTARNSPAPYASPMPSLMPNTAVTSPLPSSEGRFFKFRFGNSSATTNSFPTSPRLPSASGSKSPIPSAQHLTSASLPSLIPAREHEKEIEELTVELKREREARKTIAAQKDALESELESLSQALFEEANKMVSTERKKLAETEDELKELQAEREALRNALRLVERQSHGYSNGIDSTIDENSASALGHAHTGSTSSARAVKSPPSTRSSSPISPDADADADTDLETDLEADPDGETADMDEGPVSAGTIIASYMHRPPPLNLAPAEPLFLPPSSSPKDQEQSSTTYDTQTTHSGAQSALRSSSQSSLVKPSPNTVSPEVGGYVYPLMRTGFLPSETSPWDD